MQFCWFCHDAAHLCFHRITELLQRLGVFKRVLDKDVFVLNAVRLVGCLFRISLFLVS